MLIAISHDRFSIKMTCCSLSQFLDLIRTRFSSEPVGRWVFRGHADEAFSLIPSVGRARSIHPITNQPGGILDTKVYERALFDSFRDKAIAYIEKNPKSLWEWLAIAQHHGLPTRLLDWSENPLVALYFCVDSHSEKNSELTALHLGPSYSMDFKKNSPLEITEPRKYYPPFISSRIQAQAGLFIAIPAPEIGLEKCLPDGWCLEKITIPAKNKWDIKLQLSSIGVDRASLFPSLDGLCESLQWRFSSGPEIWRTNEPPRKS